MHEGPLETSIEARPSKKWWHRGRQCRGRHARVRLRIGLARKSQCNTGANLVHRTAHNIGDESIRSGRLRSATLCRRLRWHLRRMAGVPVCVCMRMRYGMPFRSIVIFVRFLCDVSVFSWELVVG